MFRDEKFIFEEVDKAILDYMKKIKLEKENLFTSQYLLSKLSSVLTCSVKELNPPKEA